MLWFYDIICAHVHNYIDSEQKEVSTVENELLVIQLYIGLYRSVMDKQRITKTLLR